MRQDSGNVLFLILIAVALFAALSYAVTSSSRSGSSNSSAEDAALAASEILQYAAGLKNAVMRLQASGDCAPEQISFENPVTLSAGTDYTNPNAPTNHSCHVFDPRGGGVVFQIPKPIQAYRGSTPVAQVVFSSLHVPGVGTNAPDLAFIIFGGISKTLCTEINKKLGITNDGNSKPEYGTDGGTQAFTGDYTSVSDLELENTYIYPNMFCAYDIEHPAEPNKGGLVQVLLAL